MVQADINHVYLTGELAGDPQHRELPSGLPVATVKLLVTSRFLSTNAASATSAINLTFYGPAVELAKPLRARDRVSVHGELVIRSTSPTVTRTTTEVVVRTLHELKGAANSVSTSDPSTWG